MKKILVLISAAFFLSCFSIAAGGATAGDFEQWVDTQKVLSKDYLLKNLSPSGTLPGTVVASPSKDNPNYFFHWIRDAALVVDAVVDFYIETDNDVERNRYRQSLFDFVDLSRRNQLTPTISGSLGEPKFNVDGSAFDGPWGRPQNDGPALRASALIRFAELLLQEGNEEYVLKKLYDKKLPTHSVIKADLEYVSHHWRLTNFDLWEEVRADHFYTRMVQRRAMVDGARLAKALGDTGAGGWYLKQAKEMETEIKKHWSKKRQIIIANINHTGGSSYKESGLDASTVMALNHSNADRTFMGYSDPKVLATLDELIKVFAKIYPINQIEDAPGIAIGRYPEDKYSGTETQAEGNPWFLLTAAFAEYYYRLAEEIERGQTIIFTGNNWSFFKKFLPEHAHLVGHQLKKTDRIFSNLIKRLKGEGDTYLKRIRYHVSAEGNMAEQINRHTGFQQGAHDLTWSYAAFLTAVKHR